MALVTSFLNGNRSALIILNDPKPGVGRTFIELYNAAGENIDLSNHRVVSQSGVSYTFPLGTILQPNAYLLLRHNVCQPPTGLCRITNYTARRPIIRLFALPFG